MKLFLTKRLNKRGSTHFVLPLLVIVVVGVVGVLVLKAGHAATPYVQCSRGSANSKTVYYCGWQLPTPVKYSNNTSAGSFYQSSRNYIFCQKQGLKVTSGSYYNTWWGYTISDQGHYGWANAVYTTSGSNNYGFAYYNGSSWVQVPICSSGTPPTGTTTSGGGGSTSPGSTTGYSNPFRSASYQASRIDSGVDYTVTGRIYALGSAVVKLNDRYYGGGWNGAWVAYQLTSGAAKGRYVYVTEGCSYNSSLSIGQTISSSTTVCTANSGSIETGWTDATHIGAHEALAYSWYHGTPVCDTAYPTGRASAYGRNFNSLMVKLGVKSGYIECNSSAYIEPLSDLPSGWPTW